MGSLDESLEVGLVVTCLPPCSHSLFSQVSPAVEKMASTRGRLYCQVIPQKGDVLPMLQVYMGGKWAEDPSNQES